MSVAPTDINLILEQVIRRDKGRLLASLASRLNNFALAEDCLQNALAKALQIWQKKGVPDVPSAWLLKVAQRNAIDTIRRSRNFAAKQQDIALLTEELTEKMDHDIADHRLRLMFTCCHPALETNAQVALTLHSVAGLNTSEIARAFLVKSATMGQRITRAKSKIKNAAIPFGLAQSADVEERISEVLSVIYLIYNEGYSASSGQSQLRLDLCDEAAYLARLVFDLSQNNTEAAGLLALISFSDARRSARLAQDGEFIPLHLQDRSKWDHGKIKEGEGILEPALKQGKLGPYQIQAAIHGAHCNAAEAADTNWEEIAGLYSVLGRINPSPVISLNRAVAVSFAGNPTESLKILRDLESELEGYQPFYAAMADVLDKTEQYEKAAVVFAKAAEMSDVQAEKSYLFEKQAECLAKLRLH